MIDTTTITQLVTIWMSSYISYHKAFPGVNFDYIDNALNLYVSVAIRGNSGKYPNRMHTNHTLKAT